MFSDITPKQREIFIARRILHIFRLLKYEIETLSEKIVKREKPGPLIYQKLIRAKSLTPRKSQLKWLQDCNYSDEEDTFKWELAYPMVQRCTKSTKLTEFQFKLLHRRIPTNDFLLKIGRKENDNCTFCNNSSETLTHLFWSCHVTSSFWNSVTDWLQNALPLIGKYNLLNITSLGWRPEPHSTEYSCQLIYCLLLARFHIWQAKMDEISPNFEHFLRPIKSRSIIEKKAGDTKKWNFLTDCC